MFTNANVFPSYLALSKVTLRQMFWTRRTVLILIGCALSLVIALIFRFTVGGRGNGQRIHTTDNANSVWTFGEPLRDFLRDGNHLR